jgi:hypothetical protein
MRVIAQEIFDSVIKGTGRTWYTSDELTRLLGDVDTYAIQAVPTGTSTPSPTLTITPEESADNQSWYTDDSPVIDQSIENGSSYSGSTVCTMARLRFKITLSGTAPECRLKLYFTGRSAAAAPNESM